MDYEFTIAAPMTEHEALKQVTAMGLHGLAFDDVHEADETLHWHEFEAVTWVISGTGSFADEDGNVTLVEPGCRLRAPAGWLHRTLAGTRTRLVIGTNLPYEVWTSPIDKDPSDRPAALSM
jgi:mannose-6-phosphate isomerase-like protein (cupin superfamily)